MLQKDPNRWGMDILCRFVFQERMIQRIPGNMVQELISTHLHDRFTTSGNLVNEE